jgi:plasmid replication initiation protein
MDLDKKIALIQKSIEAKNKTANVNKEVQDGRNLVDNSVTKSNALSRAYYRLTITEKRIMEAIISRLHPMRSDNELQCITLTGVDYAKTYGVALNHAYGDLSKAADGLMGKILVTNEPPHIVKTALMIQAKYQESEGYIQCTLNPLITPHLIGMRDKFSSYPLSKAFTFKSSYTWRFYELLVSWAQPKADTSGLFCGWFDVETDELRKMLGVPETYRYGMFKKTVLDKVVSELAQANITLKLVPRKTSRRITSYRITFAENDQQQLTLEGGDTKKNK